MLTRCRFLFILLLLFLEGIGFSQGKLIRQPDTDNQAQLLEFWSPDNKLLRRLDVKESNVYLNFPYKATGDSKATRSYDIDGINKATFLNSFFHTRQLTNEDISNLQPSWLEVEDEVAIGNDFAMVANHLNMLGSDGSGIGIKSTVFILNNKGEQIAKMRENNEGYFSPAITKSGKYLAVNFGDINADGAYSLIPMPGFRIYNIMTGEKIVEICSPDKYEVFPPMAFEDLIIEILQYPGDRYEYLLFDFSKRIVYSKVFTGAELDRLKRFSISAMIFSREDGAEYVEKFDTDFQKKTF